jgi:hypothetical protein
MELAYGALHGLWSQLAEDERIVERSIAETGGNPLALLELSQGLTADDPGGGGGLREADPGRVGCAGGELS